MTRSLADEKNAAACHAQALLDDEPALLSSLDFGPFVRQGIGSGPQLLIGDPSEVSLSSTGASPLEYRMAALARPGDHILVRHRRREFEAYLVRHLGLRDVTFHEAGAESRLSVSKSARLSAQLLETLGRIAKRFGGLTVTPYLTTGHSWRLAQAIGAWAGQIIHISGPSPRTSRRANDKLWFSNLARRVISHNATPPTLFSFGPAATAGLVRRISRMADQVIVKIPDSAGSAGNLRLDSTAIRGIPLANLRRFLLHRLHALGWRDRYPVLVGVWDKNVTCSPSVQLWVPLVREGHPVVEGIFEQRVQTRAATFVGATRSALPEDMQGQLSKEALCLAGVLQRLGYYGACSLDAVLCEHEAGPPRLHWIECNGRWGGVSIPLALAQRLHAAPSAPPISILQELLPASELKLPELLDKLDGLLFGQREAKTGLIVLSPPEHPHGALLNLLAISGTQEQADHLLCEAASRLADQKSHR